MKKTLTFIGNLIGSVIVLAVLYAMLVIGTAIENQIRCERGATEFCTMEGE